MVLDEVFLHHVRAGVQGRPEDAEHVSFQRVRVRRLLFISLHVGDDGQGETGQAQGHPQQVLSGVLRAQEQARENHHRYQGRARGGGEKKKKTCFETGAEFRTMRSAKERAYLRSKMRNVCCILYVQNTTCLREERAVGNKGYKCMHVYRRGGRARVEGTRVLFR